MKWSVHDGMIWHGDTKIAKDTALIVDRNELKELVERDGVVHTTMPHRIDMVFAAGRRTIGVESKFGPDLLNSFRGKRLARQARTLMEEVDVPLLLVRGGVPDGDRLGEVPTDLYGGLVQLQVIGVVVAVGPMRDREVVEWLVGYRKALASERRVLQAVAGRDSDPKPTSILQAVPGIGPALSARLKTEFGSVLEALTMVEEWGRVGVSKRVIEKARGVLE